MVEDLRYPKPIVFPALWSVPLLFGLLAMRIFPNTIYSFFPLRVATSLPMMRSLW